MRGFQVFWTLSFLTGVILLLTFYNNDQMSWQERIYRWIVVDRKERCEMEERQQRIREVCRKYNATMMPANGLLANRTNRDRRYCSIETCTVVVNTHHDLFGCMVPKVACTTFKRYFVRLLGDSRVLEREPTEQDRFHEYADRVLFRVTPGHYDTDQLRKFFKFLFVRHPFERIVSAYVDKTHKSNYYYYRTYWIPLMKKSRRREVTSQMTPTFQEFVTYLLEVDMDKYDVHWAPVWRLCQPCAVRYDYVGKLEKGSSEIQEVLDKLPIPMAVRWNWGSNNSNNKTKAFFSNISTNDIIALYNKYFLDFEMFGYDIREYLNS